MPTASGCFARLGDARWDPPRVAGRLSRESDGGLKALDWHPRGAAGRRCDALHDARCCFQPFPTPSKTLLSSSQAKPFESSPSECASSCAWANGAWAAMEVQCNLKCDLNQRPKDPNRDPGALLICDLVTSVGFVVAAAAIGRDDWDGGLVAAAGHFVDPSPLRCHKCDADSD